MAEPCDDFESCGRICNESIYYGIYPTISYLRKKSIFYSSEYKIQSIQ